MGLSRSPATGLRSAMLRDSGAPRLSAAVGLTGLFHDDGCDLLIGWLTIIVVVVDLVNGRRLF